MKARPGSKYVVGLDGGGTKSHCAVCDTNGNLIDLIAWGPTNHELLAGGYATLQNELRNLTRVVLVKNGLQFEQIAQWVLGLAGVDTRSQYGKITAILAEIGVADYLLCNDAYLGVKAGCRSGSGICAINGTGCTVAGIDVHGKMQQIGGQFELTGDYGGGVILGTAVVKAVYNSLFKGTVPTYMTELLFKKLQVRSKHDLMDRLVESVDAGDINIKDLARIVFEAANQKDQTALRICETMGHENARSINALINELEFAGPNLEITLAGSLYTRGENPTAIMHLKQDVLAANPGKKITFHILECPPVAGALIWALETQHVGSLFYDKIVAQVRDAVSQGR